MGDLSMSSNKENDYSARQLQSVEITQAAKPCRVSFVKLVLHKNHQNRKNQYNQVGLYGVNLIGQPTSTTTSEGDWLEDGDVLSPYDDLSFLMYTDTEVAQLIAKLEKKKQEAVATERFEYAKKIKSAIGELVEAGQMLASLQMFVCVTYCAMGLAVLATAMSLIQEGLMIKAERMKKKMGLGRGELITIETIKVRERAG